MWPHPGFVRGNALSLTTALLVTLGLAAASAASPGEGKEFAEMEKRLLAMKEKAPDLSITVFSPTYLGTPFPAYGEFLCLLLERTNLREVELSEELFTSPKDAEFGQVDRAFRAFVRRNPVKTDYALFAEYVAPWGKDIWAIRTFVLDGSGNPVWVNLRKTTEEDFQRVNARGTDGAALVLVYELCEALGLPDPLRRDVPRGKWAAHFARKAGAPSDSLDAAMDERATVMRKRFKDSRVSVFPAVVNDRFGEESAAPLVSLMNESKLSNAKAAVGDTSLRLDASANETKRLWDFARSCSARVKQGGLDADYSVHPRYVIRGDTEEDEKVASVQFVLCDREGEWVIVDTQNEYGEEFQGASPRTISDCDRLVVKRLAWYLTPKKVTGIGVNLKDHESGALLVLRVAENGPAAEAGVRTGDLITAVDGKGVKNLSMKEAVERITGEAGTKVNITIRRGTQTLEMTMTRREVVFE